MSPGAHPQPDGRSKKRPGVEEQRSIITQAAVALFAENGTRAVSIAQICAHADVSRPTFYRCFPDKEALVDAIYEQAVNAHVGSVLHDSNLDDPAQMRIDLEAMLDAIFAQGQLARLVFVEASDPQSPAAQIVEKDFDTAARVLARNMKRAGETPSRVYLKSVMAAVQWIVHDAIRKGLTPKARREAKEATLELVLSTLGKQADRSGQAKLR